MAELVGDAYIRITADTTVMRRALARDMKQAGKDDAGAYVRSFSNQVKSTADRDLAKARQTLASGLADPKVFDAQVRHFASIENAAEHWRKKLRQLDSQHKLAKGDMDVFTNAIGKWESAAVKARDTTRDLNKAHEEAIIINKRATDEWAAHRIEADRNAKALERVRKQEEMLARLRQRERDRQRGIKRDVDGNIIGRASRLGRSLDRIDYRLDRMGDKVGRLFGKGSRNNFINIIGAMAGGLTRLAGKLVSFPLRVVGAFTDAFAAFSQTFEKTGSILKSAGSFGGALFSGLASAGPALIAATAALFVFSNIIPGVVAGLSLLAGAVVATASAISYGLVGALLAVGPAAAGALAGVGGVFLAITQFANDKKNKKLMKEWFSDTFKNWAKPFAGEVKTFLSGVHDGIHVLLDDLTPSTNAFFASWEKNMKDPATKAGLNAISDSIGRIATTFNTALPQLASGLVAFFGPILPYAERLATAIGEAFKNFDDWANSAAGKKSIGEFMQTAWADAKKVWDILVDIKDIIFTVFEQSEPTGAGILDGIHRKLREIITWLQDPANKGKIQEWFANAGDMAVSVGELAGHVGDIMRNFNSPEGQANAKGIMDSINAIGAAAATVSSTADAIGRIFGWLEKLVHFGAPEGANGHGWLHNMIWGEDKKTPPPPVFKPQNIPTQTKEQVFAGRKDVVEKYRVTITPQTVMAKEQLKAIEDYQFKGKTIPIKGNEALWALMRDTAAAYVFTEKQIVVGADTTEWDAAKGTAAGYVFDTKNIKLTADASDIKAAVASAKAYLATLPATKRIRIAGVNGQGGITTAAGGYFDQASLRVVGEAGPEAVVPLDRDLFRVDPAVRQMSAVLQSMTGGRGGGGAVPNSGPKVNFEAGAFAVNLPTGDPRLAAEAVLDRLVAYL